MIDRFNGKYAFLSNYYDSTITDGTFYYDTVEAYFQAQKTLDMDKRREIADAPTPGLAKRLGRQVKLRPDWENIKVKVMEEALRKKFAEPCLRQALLDTGDKYLIEGNTWHDQIWGSCQCEKHKDRPGLNMLGQILMEIRNELKNDL